MQGEQRLSGYFISHLFSRLEWRIAATLITSDASLHTPHATYCLFTFGRAQEAINATKRLSVRFISSQRRRRIFTLFTARCR
jgi:hypothetical protein